ncbi:unnamed protein product, partial [Owenia fusiformis]
LNPNSKACNEGVKLGDIVESINGQSIQGYQCKNALDLIKSANQKLVLELKSGDSSMNGQVNGDIKHSFVSNNNEGESRKVEYKPVSFGTSPQGPSVLSPSSKGPTFTKLNTPPIVHNASSVNTTPLSITPSFQSSQSYTAPSVNTAPSMNTPPSMNITLNAKKADENKPIMNSLTAKPGVWTPGAKPPTPEHEKPAPTTKIEDSRSPFKDMAQVWKPGGDSGSKKEFKPVKLDTTAIEREKSKSPVPPKPEESFAWKPPEKEERIAAAATISGSLHSVPPRSSSKNYTKLNINGDTHTSMDSNVYIETNAINGRESQQSPDANSSSTFERRFATNLPSTSSLSPTITLLQKSREGQIPKGAVYVGTEEKVEGEIKHTDQYYLVPSGEKTKTTRKIEQKAPKYQGIGPTNEKGVPVGLRSHIDDKNQKDWYKQMYKTLHKQPKRDDENPYSPTYTFPESSDEEGSTKQEDENPYTPNYMFPTSQYSRDMDKDETRSLDQYATYPRSKSLSEARPTYDTTSDVEYSSSTTERPRKSLGSSWAPPHARSKLEVYKNQPRSIVDYEPGFSSIAFKEAKSSGLHNPPIDKPGQFSRYTEGPDSDVRSVGSGSQLSPLQSKEAYRQVLVGGEVPVSGFRKQVPDRPAALPKRYQEHARKTQPIRSPASTLDRKKIAEDDAKRREHMLDDIDSFVQQMYEEEKRRKAMEEKQRNEARRHSDNLLPEQKSPIPTNRFDEGDRLPDHTKLRKKKIGTEIRGKAKAIYTFNAQNPKELSFKRGDSIYLTRDIDGNWLEGEHHGRIGIFPKNYVEVLTSIADAKAAAADAEGQGRVKYNFNAQTNVELSLKKGDTVTLTRRLDENWYEGRCKNQTGIFPTSYIDVIREPDTPLVTPMSSRMTTPATSGFTTPANYDLDSPNGPLSPNIHMNGPTDGIDAFSPTPMDNYKRQQQDSFHYNGHGGHEQQSRVPEQRSSAQQQQSEQRSYGVKQQSQSSPHGYRQEYMPPVQKQPQQRAPQKQELSPSKKDIEVNTYRAIYNYKPRNEDELELKEGDEIYVMERCDDGWFVGTSNRTGHFGTFPGNYVTKL